MHHIERRLQRAEAIAAPPLPAIHRFANTPAEAAAIRREHEQASSDRQLVIVHWRTEAWLGQHLARAAGAGRAGMIPFERRLAKVEAATNTKVLPSFIMYEADRELSAEERGAFIRASVGATAPNPLIIGEIRAIGTGAGPTLLGAEPHTLDLEDWLERLDEQAAINAAT